MHRRTFLIGTAGLIGTTVLGGCSSDSDTSTGPGDANDGGTDTDTPAPRVTLRLPGEDSGLPSPFAYMRGPGYIQSSYIYDTLMWKDGSGELLPWLASDFTAADDGLSYTFSLREVNWHDGRPLTAEDVAFTFEYFRTQTISPQVIIQPMPEIQEVRAIDPRTVEFRLSKPMSSFFGRNGVGSVPIVPKHIWSTIPEAAKASDLAVLVGSGPYRLESYTRGEGAYLYQANDDYFLGVPFVQRLEYRPVGDKLAGLLAGELDAATASGVLPAVLQPFRSNDAFEVVEAPAGNSGSGLFFNQAKGGALADVAFRRACAHAIDRADIVQRLFGGNGEPGNPGWIPPANPFHVDVEQYAFDRTRAESLLDDAGYRRPGGQGTRQGPDGQPLRFPLLSANPLPPVAELVVNALGAVGVEVTPQAVDTPSFNQRVIAGDTELSIISYGGMNTDHGQDGYLEQVYSSKTKTTQHAQGYANPQVDQLLDRQKSVLDEAERKDLLGQAQRLIAADLPLLPLFYSGSANIFRTATFDQWYYTPGGVGSTVPTPENKQTFITGRESGTEIRPAR